MFSCSLFLFMAISSTLCCYNSTVRERTWSAGDMCKSAIMIVSHIKFEGMITKGVYSCLFCGTLKEQALN